MDGKRVSGFDCLREFESSSSNSVEFDMENESTSLRINGEAGIDSRFQSILANVDTALTQRKEDIEYDEGSDVEDDYSSDDDGGEW